MADTSPESVHTELYTVGGHKWTFEDKATRTWVEERLSGRVLNACAGETALRYDGTIVRNDVNTDRPADYHLKVRDLPDELGTDRFDTIVYDPPWSVFQSNEEYEGEMVGENRIMAEALHEMLREGGTVIGFGYRSTVMPADLGYKRQEVAIFNTIGRTKDYFGVVDKRMNASITGY
jgi:hypothetical protein